MYIKKFDASNEVKKRINHIEHSLHIRSGEIRWISFGVNVGSEIDGKGTSFTRPALIIHVVGKTLALVVPMSTRLKPFSGYESFDWKNKRLALCLHQVKIISQKRILSRKGKISEKRLLNIKKKIKRFYKF